MNLYDELELPSDCTHNDIKQKYRTLAQIHHPDKGGDEEKFKRIKSAYETLINPKRRAHYDSTGEYQEDMSIRSECLNRLLNMITHYVQQINPELDDLILKMKVDIYHAQQNVNNSIGDCESAIRKLNMIAGKIKMKKDGDNLLKTFTLEKIKQKENEIIQHKRTLLVFDDMLEILEDYHFSLDEWQLLLDNQ